jgi:tetratricopeptide (TPR) repeat protein/YHS domain-containing protein
MRSLHRAIVGVALTLSPLMGTGCVNLARQKAIPQSVMRSGLKMNSARLEESRGNLGGARRLYAEIHQLDPGNAECSHRLAVVCTRLSQHGDAELYFRQAYAVKANDAELLADMGYAAYLRKDYAESEDWLEQSVNLNPNDRRTITNLAVVRAWRGNDDSSLATFRRVNTESDSIRNLAAIQIERGDKEMGLQSYRLASGVKTSVPEASAAISLTAADVATQELKELLPPLPGPTSSVQTVSWIPLTHCELLATSEYTITHAVVPPLRHSVPAAASSSTFELAPPPQTNGPVMAILSAARQAPIPIPALSITSADVSPLELPSPVENLDSNIPIPSSLADVALNSEPSLCVTASDFSTNPLPQAPPKSVWRKTPRSHGGPADEPQLTQVGAVYEPRSLSSIPTADKSGLQGICLVTLSEEKRLAVALPQFMTEYHSQSYQFSSAEALQKFIADPERYVPAAGGLDVVSVRNERAVTNGSLKHALWHRHRLYMFSSREHADAFRADPHKFAAD